jgi:hypothetical protein
MSQHQRTASTPEWVPDHYVVVRGGVKPLPPCGEQFSGAAGPDAHDAAKGIPHGQMRATTAGEIRAHGGRITFAPEPTKSGQINDRHVNIVEGTSGAFGPIGPNPVPKSDRVG